MDVVSAVLVLILLSPVYLLVSLLVLVDSRGAAFFVQPRAGKNGEIFNLLKFRTMRPNREENGQPLDDLRRITKLGAFLRKYSLDELPQFINVLKGDMSLVGPRPLLMKYVPLYSRRQARRLEVRPGITGLPQVSGRNKLTWREKFELDVFYVDNYSFLLDLRIMLLTVMTVVRREGINSSESVTMHPFEGNKEGE